MICHERNVGYATFFSLDVVLTMLILMGGAERISEVLKNIDASKAVSEKPAPIEITGKLTLDEGSTISRSAGQGR